MPSNVGSVSLDSYMLTNAVHQQSNEGFNKKLVHEVDWGSVIKQDGQ